MLDSRRYYRKVDALVVIIMFRQNNHTALTQQKLLSYNFCIIIVILRIKLSFEIRLFPKARVVEN